MSTIPPTYSTGVTAPPVRRVWPTVVGVITIVFGTFGFIGAGCGMLVPLMLRGQLEALGHTMGAMQAKQIEQISSRGGWFIASGIVSMIMSGILIAAALQLLRRRPIAVRWYRGWAIVQIAWALVGSIVGYRLLSFGVVDASTPDAAGQMVGQVIGLGFGVLWGLSMPIFILVWFTRRPIREEIATWSPGAEST